MAVPLVVAASSNKAARMGVSYNNINTFSNISDITAIAFDKTGTLTKGQMSVTFAIGKQEYIDIFYLLEAEKWPSISKIIY